MTDESNPGQNPSHPPDGKESEIISEQELDQILSQASSLAANLSEDVGSPGQSSPERSISDTSQELDAELSELERLVSETAVEVDGMSETTDEAVSASEDMQEELASDTPEDSSRRPAQKDKEASAAEPLLRPKPPPVPDFMDEFTHPEEPLDGKSPSAVAPKPMVSSSKAASEKPAAPVALPKPGVVRSRKTGTVDAGIRFLDEESPQTSVSTHEGDESEVEVEQLPPLKRLIRQIPALLSPVVCAACMKAVAVLDIIDRPFSGLGKVPRRLIGLAAISTAGLAVIILLISLFD